jgi:hypothetical protein
MIYLVCSRQSYEQLAGSPAWPPAALWVSLGVLEPSELAELRACGVAVTDFTKTISSGDAAALADAIDTIREHHPGQAVWVDSSAAT